MKCPYCKRQETVDEAAEDSKFCLQSEDGVLMLSRSHVHYTQIQTQMFVEKVTVTYLYGQKRVFIVKEFYVIQFYGNSIC